MVVQHTRRAGELKSEGIVDAGRWGMDRGVVNNLAFRSSAGTPGEEATTRTIESENNEQTSCCDLLLR